MTGASGRTTQDAKAVKEQDPETFEEIKRGERTVTQAKKTLTGTDRGVSKAPKRTAMVPSKPAPAKESDGGIAITASSLRRVWTQQINGLIPDTDQPLHVVGRVSVTDADGTNVLLQLPSRPSTDT
jgi:hypothetical protein